MPTHALTLSVVPDQIAVCRLPAHVSIPAWATMGWFFSVTRTADELSIVCLARDVPPGVQHQGGWRAFKLHGPFAFDLTGVLLVVLEPLAAANIGIFAISTYDTDYVLVDQTQLAQAMTVLRDAGHTIIAADQAALHSSNNVSNRSR